MAGLERYPICYLRLVLIRCHFLLLSGSTSCCCLLVLPHLQIWWLVDWCQSWLALEESLSILKCVFEIWWMFCVNAKDWGENTGVNRSSIIMSLRFVHLTVNELVANMRSPRFSRQRRTNIRFTSNIKKWFCVTRNLNGGLSGKIIINWMDK